MRRFKTMLHLTQASLLAGLMLWFGTHHIAPHFFAHPLHVFTHAHDNCCDETPEVEATAYHPEMQHCEFCFSGGINLPQLENALPRAPQQQVQVSADQKHGFTRVSRIGLARAPPVHWVNF